MKTLIQFVASLLLVASLAFPLASLSHASMGNDISADEFVKMDKQALVLLDVRTINEFQDGHIAGAINLPIADLPDLFTQLSDKDQKVVVYCRSGVRAGKAITFLEEQGYTNLVHLDGDFSEWAENKRPIVKP